jgi:GTP-binding protein HflX
MERAILVGAPIKGRMARGVMTEHLDELERLADTAGAQTIGRLTQQLVRPDSRTYLGKGKIDELGKLIEETQATLVIFDDELSPAQGRNIETALGKRVMDRAELILDIFATRARTSEARMQVELAQLEYALPRLTRMWTHLDTMRGGVGIGTRGPGETQLETDRRLINHRIKLLRQRLDDVRQAREVQRQSRQSEFTASLVGYTNAGKSSILRALAQAKDIFVEDRLFATLDPLTREVLLGDKQHVLVTDTVGFIRKLPHDLVASFRATLEETRDADLLLHVIDASHPAWEEHRQTVNEVLEEIGVTDTPVLHVFNKTDRLTHDELTALQERIERLVPNSVFVSATEPDGLEPLRRSLLAEARKQRPVTELRIPMRDGRSLAQVHQWGEVLDQREDGEDMVVRARLDEAAVGRLRQAGVAVGNGRAG